MIIMPKCEICGMCRDIYHMRSHKEDPTLHWSLFQRRIYQCIECVEKKK